MNVNDIEKTIADKLTQLRARRMELEEATMVIDIDDPAAPQLDAKLRATIENLSFIEVIALSIVEQNDTIARQREEIDVLTNQVLAYRNINTRYLVRHNAARAVTALLTAKYQRLEKDTMAWIESQLSDNAEIAALQNLLAA